MSAYLLGTEKQAWFITLYLPIISEMFTFLQAIRCVMKLREETINYSTNVIDRAWHLAETECWSAMENTY